MLIGTVTSELSTDLPGTGQGMAKISSDAAWANYLQTSEKQAGSKKRHSFLPAYLRPDIVLASRLSVFWSCRFNSSSFAFSSSVCW